jgi:hypothetical protein
MIHPVTLYESALSKINLLEVQIKKLTNSRDYWRRVASMYRKLK